MSSRKAGISSISFGSPVGSVTQGFRANCHIHNQTYLKLKLLEARSCALDSFRGATSSCVFCGFTKVLSDSC